jgi:hypothetical protein
MPHKITPPFYWVWSNMKDRCRNPNNIQWKDYGGRGIRVCERWKSYKNFADDMGPRPTGTLIDRIDNDGDYEPGNCRWSTHKAQCRNTRSNRILEFEGTRLCIADWANVKGWPEHVIDNRLRRGWSVERTLTTSPNIKPPRSEQPSSR